MWTLRVLLVALVAGPSLQAFFEEDVGLLARKTAEAVTMMQTTSTLQELFLHVMRGKGTPESCLTCEIQVTKLKNLFKNYALEVYATQLCDYNLTTRRVCEGLIQRYLPHLMYIMQYTSLSSEEICALHLGDDCVSELGLTPALSWKIALPPRPQTVTKKSEFKQENGTYSVLHLTDVHLDASYAEGSLARCKEPLCCQEYSGTPKRSEEAAGVWGDYRKCDSPIAFTENLLEHISKNHEVDYIMWGGDTEPHDIWKTTRKSIIKHNRILTQMIQKYFRNVPVFPNIGNHEGHPVNMFPPPEQTEEFSMRWLYKGLSKEWAKWLDDSSRKTFVKHGAYSTKVYPGFRIISLNTNYCNRFNFWLIFNSTDPGGQLKWLTDELYEAEKKGEKVHILGHIAPSTNDCIRVWIRNYNAIIERFQKTVTGQFFGHTHEDKYRIMYNNDGVPFSVMYLTPSVTPYSALNPAYRIYTVDKKTKDVIDHTTYYMDLAESNKLKKIQWKKEYSALDAYKMKSLSPEEWHRVTEDFRENEEAFDQFYSFLHRRSEEKKFECYFPSCKRALKSETICRLQSKDIVEDYSCWPDD